MGMQNELAAAKRRHTLDARPNSHCALARRLSGESHDPRDQSNQGRGAAISSFWRKVLVSLGRFARLGSVTPKRADALHIPAGCRAIVPISLDMASITASRGSPSNKPVPNTLVSVILIWQ